MIERGGSGFTLLEYDKLSIVHVTFAEFSLLFWLGARYVSTQTRQLIYTIIAALILTSAMIWLFPKIIDNPLNDTDPAIQPIFAMISEYQTIEGLPRTLIYFGSALICLPWAVWRLRQHWYTTAYRWCWVLLAGGLLVYISFGVNWLRWCLYAALFMSIILGDLIAHLDDWISSKCTFPSRIFIKTFVVLAVAVGPMIVGASLLHASKTDQERLAEKENACPVEKLSAFLSQSSLGDTSKTIAASANFGPEIMYRTNHKVLATVHHRSVSGILDGYYIFNGTDDEIITSIIAKRQVDLLVMCPGTGNDAYFLRGGNSGSLYKRLENEAVPDWLSPIKLPIEVAGKFKVFSVQRTN
jgi:hypothetical protein